MLPDLGALRKGSEAGVRGERCPDEAQRRVPDGRMPMPGILPTRKDSWSERRPLPQTIFYIDFDPSTAQRYTSVKNGSRAPVHEPFRRNQGCPAANGYPVTFCPTTAYSKKMLLVVGTRLIWPAAAAARISVSEVNCLGWIVLKTMSTSFHTGLKPGPSPGAGRASITGVNCWPAALTDP